MTVAQEEVLKVVKAVVEEVGADAGFDELLEVGMQTPLYGGASNIDSLTLVRLIAELEVALEKGLGKRVVLASEKAMSRRHSPFGSVGSLVNFVAEQLATDNA